MTKMSCFVAEATEGHPKRKEDRILAEIDAIKKLHGNNLLQYKNRLWEEMIVRLRQILTFGYYAFCDNQ